MPMYNPLQYGQSSMQRVQGYTPEPYSYGQNPILNYQPQYPTQQAINTGLKGRAVTSLEEARASQIDLDGSLHVFTDIANGRIYTKQLGMNGQAIFNTYVLAPQENNNEKTVENKNEEYLPRKEFEQLKTQLWTELNELKNSIQPQQIQFQDKKGGKN